MVRFDRYLVAHARTLDLASGHVVHIERRRKPRVADALFATREGRTLIDLEPADEGRIEIWEPWVPRGRPARLDAALTDFVELLECARHGAPRAFDLEGPARDHDYLTRALAREARVRGWVPIAVELLGVVSGRDGRTTSRVADRSLVIFTEASGLSGDATVALLHLARRDARPHVLVRSLAHRSPAAEWPFGPAQANKLLLHEEVQHLQPGSAKPTDQDRTEVERRPAVEAAEQATADVSSEALARWGLLLLEDTAGGDRSSRAIELAGVLAARKQPFEAQALIETVDSAHAELAERRDAIAADLQQRSLAQAAIRLDATACATVAASQSQCGGPAAEGTKGWDMVDDFVVVLQLCQDIEDEQTALARVGAFLRDRLQASSVAFIAREGPSPRVLARVGSETAGTDLAVRSIETGVAIRPARAEGPVESASPVRHAAEVIGAVWCRWSAGTPVAMQQAVTLLGIAAAAVAPSVRLAIARTQPPSARTNPVPEMVGDSVSMVAVRDALLRAAASPFPVVIEGESGSGKELAARAIHARSVRRDRQFCAINCAALVDDLVEAELFGHVRGAFTGAANDRAGVFEDANRGTLFLDEIAELGPRVQAKLLRTLQEGEIRRLGETVVRKVDVRIVAATNRPLGQAVAAGAFRADLWYRLDVIRITLPALRERLEDLPALVGHLWRALAARTGSRAALSSGAVAALAAYDWPGNIRELQNVLASMLVSAPRGGLIGASALPAHIARAAAFERGATLADARRQFDERYVRAALARSGGRTASAARDLGLSRQGLCKLMGRLGIADARRESTLTANVQ
jgi:DNA-binding NtrC family response regulator